MAFLIAFIAAAGASTTDGTGLSNLRLLKDTVLQYEPIYVEIIDPQTTQDWQNQKRQQLNAFESRKRGAEPWTHCAVRYPFVELKPQKFSDANGAVHQRLGPIIVNREFEGPQCDVAAVGEFEIRWSQGAPVRVVVQPVPENERAGAALMRGTPLSKTASFVGKLASSAYAGYVIFRFFPERSIGPENTMRERLAEEQHFEGSQLRASLASRSRDALAMQIFLKAHPDFIFADRARLLLADRLVFLGQCEDAHRELRQVTGESRDAAAKYLYELELIEREGTGFCKA
ncbi:MAG: hypothetical protein ACLQIH_00950 [Myxococcaceae bacterium]